MEQNVNERQGKMIGLDFFFQVLKDHLVIILVAAVLCAVGAGVYKYATTTPTYTSELTLFVNGAGTNTMGQVYVSSNSPSSSRLLAEAFGQAMHGNSIAEDARKVLVGERAFDEEAYPELAKKETRELFQKMSVNQIQTMLSVNVNTQIITLKATHPNPYIAYCVAQAVEIISPSFCDNLVNLNTAEQGENSTSVVKVSNRAQKDGTPSSRGEVTYGVFGFAAAAFLVYMVAFLRAFFDNMLYSEEDLKNAFNIPVIGQIPSWTNRVLGNGKRAKKKEMTGYISENGAATSSRDYRGRILNEKTPFAITEAFKMLRTNMCYTTKGEACPVYGVTSATVGAGKSVVMTNAAISFGQMGKRVLLIDGDMRCPALHNLLGLEDKGNGFSELLAGVCADESQVIRPSGFENVDLITSGHIPPNPVELLASERMRDFLKRAKTKYDVIFIDLPPICEVSDAGVISDVVTGYAFIIRSGYSDSRLVAVAVETMENLGAHVIGFILNDIDIKSGAYYKNRYGYGYGKYSKYGVKEYAISSKETDDKKNNA